MSEIERIKQRFDFLMENGDIPNQAAVDFDWLIHRVKHLEGGIRSLIGGPDKAIGAQWTSEWQRDSAIRILAENNE